MNEFQPPIREIEYMNNIFKKIETYNRIYKGAEVWIATSIENDELKLLSGQIVFIDSKDCEEKTLQYPQVTIQKYFLNLIQIKNLIKTLIEKGTFITQDKQKIQVDGRLSHYNDYNSFDIPMKVRWATSLYDYEIISNRGNEPRFLLAIDLPYYPDFNSFLKDWLNISKEERASQYRGKIPILLPNYTARIDKWKMRIGEVEVSINNKHSKLNNLLIKYNIETEKSEIIKRDIKIDSKHVLFNVPSDIESMHIMLINKENEEALDWRRYSSQGWGTKDIEIEIPVENLDYLISRGESQTIEFKQEINDSTSKQKIVETSVAFSNKYGGKIIIGVEDNLTKVGIENENPEDMINNILRDKITPPISVRYNKVPFEGNKYILIIIVPEGSDKPYFIENKGYLIRASGSNRQIKRYELDKIFANKK